MLIYDLFYLCLNVLGVILFWVLIYKVKEGVFYLYIYFKKDEEIIWIDVCILDVVVLVVRVDCFIFIYEFIFECECIWLIDGDECFDILEEDENLCMELVSIIFFEEVLNKVI